ncbi:Sensor histidine kinase with PAS/PAC and Response regulator receiver domain [Rhodovulum sp. P5]|nr:Sensor histidine kinase with PAS/PAC and Response regulator receiver domain [Rhodovulum sp. P5]
MGATSEEVAEARGNWTAWTLPQDRDIADAAKSALLDSGEGGRLAFRIQRKSGEVGWLQEFVAPLQGPVSLGFLRDVTAERLSAEAFATARNFATMTTVAGRMSHRSANALSVVIAALDLLSQTPLSLRNRMFLADAQEAAKEMESLVRALQGVAFGGVSKPEKIDLQAAVRDAEATIRRSAPENIDLSVNVDAGLKDCVAGASAMKIALMTLLLNAIDCLPEGGEIEIRAENTCLDPRQAERHGLSPGPYVQVAVRDSRDTSGVQAEVDDPETDLASSLMPSTNFVSLYSLIRHFGGLLLSEIIPDEGAEIRFVLPACEPGRQERATSDKMLGRAKPSARLLLVDDDRRMRRIVTDWLLAEGYDVHRAASGDEAVAMIGGGLRPELIATDIVMPGIMQGNDVVWAARQLIENLPAIYLSAYPSDTVVARRTCAPGDIVLAKPLERTVFLNAVRRAVASCELQTAQILH